MLHGPQPEQFLTKLQEIINLVNFMEQRGEIPAINRGNGFLSLFFAALPPSSFFAKFAKAVSELVDSKHPAHAIYHDTIEEHDYQIMMVMLTENKANLAKSLARELGDLAAALPLNIDRKKATHKFQERFDIFIKQNSQVLEAARAKVFVYYRDLADALNGALKEAKGEHKPKLQLLLNEAMVLLNDLAPLPMAFKKQLKPVNALKAVPDKAKADKLSKEQMEDLVKKAMAVVEQQVNKQPPEKAPAVQPKPILHAAANPLPRKPGMDHGEGLINLAQLLQAGLKKP
jgi:hypothetical protein